MILENRLQSSVQKLELWSDWMFQQDNASKHTSKLTLARFEYNNIQIMKWPRQSVNLNPIEKLCKLLKKRIRERRPKDLSKMIFFFKEEWANIPIKTCQTHVENYRNYLLALFDNIDSPTKYQILLSNTCFTSLYTKSVEHLTSKLPFFFFTVANKSSSFQKKKHHSMERSNLIEKILFVLHKLSLSSSDIYM